MEYEWGGEQAFLGCSLQRCLGQEVLFSLTCITISVMIIIIVKNAAQYGLSLFTTRLWLLLLASVFKREDKLLCVPA